MIPFFYFNIALVGLATFWSFLHLPGHGFHVLTSSNFLTSLVLLATVVGLLRRHPLALSSLLGLAGLLCCIPISFLIAGYTESTAPAGGGFMKHILPTVVPSFVSGFADDLVFNLVISTIALITFRMIRSVKFSNYYEVEKASWPRAFASMGVLLVLFMLNYTTAEKKAAVAGAPGALDSLSTIQNLMNSPDLQEAIASGDMTAIAQKFLDKQASGTPAEKKALRDLQNQLGIKGLPTAVTDTALGGEAEPAPEPAPNATVCRFALDDSHLAIERSNRDLAVLDLRTRQITHRTITAGEKIFGPDLDLYFDVTSTSVRKFADPSFQFLIPRGSRFLSFTATPQQILIYDQTSSGIRRIEIPTGRVIWNVAARLDDGATHFAFTSLDLNWAYLKLATGKPVLFNIVTGRLLDPDLSFSHIRSVEFGATPSGTANWARVSGQSDDGRTRLALVDLQTSRTEELPIPDADVALFDRDRRTYVTSVPPIQLKNYSVASDGGINVSTRDLGLSAPVLFTSLLGGGRFVALGVQAEKQMMVIDLDRSALFKVGSVFDGDFSPGRACFAVSATRQLFAVAAGSSVQVFWTSELANAAPRSLSVPLAPPLKR